MAKKNSNHEIQLRIQNALLEQDYVHAEQLLESFKIANTIDKVYKTKTLAQLAISQFQFQKAYNIYYQLQLGYPFDLEIKSEYIFILHQLGLTIELKNQIELFTELWDKQNSELIPCHLNAGILVAKINEELGRFDQSFKILEKCKLADLSAYQKQAVFLQMMRIALELNQREFIELHYYDLAQGFTFHKEFQIEREHILLLADFYFADKNQILLRVEKIKQLKLNTADQIFLNSEILEHQLINKFAIDRSLLNNDIDTYLIYETNQLQLFKNKLNNFESGELDYSDLQKKLSPMLMIRLLRQNFLLFPNDVRIEYILKNYQMLCSQIKPKKVSQHYLSYLPDSNLTELVFKTNKMRLVTQNKESSIQSETYQRFIQLFTNEQKSYDLDVVAQIIYNEKYDSHHYDRIRIAVSRLNRQIQNDLLIQQLFKINKHQLCITMNIRKEVG